MARQLRIAFLALFILVGSAGYSQADKGKDALKELEAEFNAVKPGVRPEHPLLLLNYVEHAGVQYSYRLPGRFARLASDGAHFRIRKLKRKKEHIELEVSLADNDATRLKIYLHDNDKMSEEFQTVVAPLMLSDLFLFRESPTEFRFTGNKDSSRLHLTACNHLPDEAKRVSFRSVEEAELAAFIRCAACFADSKPLPIPGYAQVRRSAMERARLHEIIFPPIDDPSVQTRVAELGMRLLDAYPFALKGYSYEFRVLRSEYIQATAFPTGFIFITDTIYDAAESEMELATVIAHEIAHVEMGLLFDVNTSSANTLGEAELLYQTRREQEMAADWAAAWTVMNLTDASTAFADFQNVLRKAAFVMGESLNDEESKWDTHPSAGRRIRALDLESLRLTEERRRFCGLNDDGDVIIECTPLAVGLDDEESYIVLAAEVSDLLNESFQLRKGARVGQLHDASGNRFYLGGQVKYTLQPGQSDILRIAILAGGPDSPGSPDAFHKFDIKTVDRLELRKIPKVDRWEVCVD